MEPHFNPSSVIKVVSVFLAAVIVVLGGALIYSRTREARYPIQAVQSAPIAGQPASEQARPPETNAPAAMPVPRSDQSRRTPSRTIASVQDSEPLDQNSPSEVGEAPEHRTAPLEAFQSPPPTIPKPAVLEPAPVVSQITQSAPPQSLPDTAAADGAAAPPPYTATLQPGTALIVQLREILSSDRNREGDVFRGTLDTPLVVNGFTLADQGATVLGKVVNAQKARLLGSASDLTLVLTEVTTKDGQLIRIETSPWNAMGKKVRLKDAPKVAIGAAYGAAVGAVSGAAKGAGVGEGYDRNEESESAGMNQKAVVIPIGARLTFHLASPIKITEKR
ncbi:MAG: hypothetical protein JO097_19450 [Acidobacteriaceae bacterium]|nr:hypothetical protein [Acidobacteriaceae bacterium]MBV9294098.1 hypothetical protein [Acidobacteriaceae bacterium]MBV9766518.1 hypothetical protein [Acidobacteriaceae bacterium]